MLTFYSRIRSTSILLMLAMTFGVIPSCSEESDTTESDERLPEPDAGLAGALPETSLTNIHINKHNAGIDFFALGTEPFWSLDMDFDQSFFFKPMEGEEIAVPPVEAVFAQDANVRRYRAVTEATEMIIQLIKEPCSDGMSDRTYPYTVRLEVKATKDKEFTSYRGCGAFTIDPGLHNIWAIESIDGMELVPGNYRKGIPTLEFNVGNNTISGHDGCNSIHGTFDVEENKITFGPLAGTLMACPNAELSARIGRTLSQKEMTFAFTNKLELRQGDKLRMTLRNVD